MLEKFNFGDQVCVSEHIVSYSTTGKRDLYSTVGVVVDKTPNSYGVKLAGLRSSEDKDGLFWFKPQDIIPQEEMDKLDNKKEVLVGDLKNGYSYATAKEAEELRIQREAAEKLRHEVEDMIAKTYFSITFQPPRSVEITKVIFNDPATIVFWSDGKKTVVKCAESEVFDEEKGLAMAISKRVLGNKDDYYNEFKKWLPRIEVPCGRKNCDECDDLSLNKAITGDARYECYSCRYLEVPLNKEPCEDCNYHNSKYKPMKGEKNNGRRI